MKEQFTLRIEGIEKRFSGVTVLNNINLELRGGEIHAIIGENGAGKSTLMMVIGGIHCPDHGSIYFNNQPITFRSPMDAQQHGIAIVYQELSLVPSLTVAENIFAGRELRHFGWFADRKRMNTEAQMLLSRLGGGISATERVDCLSVAKKQIVEIAKAISIQAKGLILDEPTSSLNDAGGGSPFSSDARFKR